MTYYMESIGATENGTSESPFTKEFFLVQGRNFRCMAYKDREGKWHAAFNELELPEPVHVLA